MKSTVIEVTSKGGGIDEALSLTEKLGTESGICKKSVIHLRLLAEELLGMLRSIAGDVSATTGSNTTDRILNCTLNRRWSSPTKCANSSFPLPPAAKTTLRAG